MNKKYLMIGLPILALGLVMAGVLVHYGVFNQEINVVSAIDVSGCKDTITGEDIHSGDIFEGENCIITNVADTERIITISNDANTNEIEVSYLKSMDMESKYENWTIKEVGAVLYYTTIGNNFIYKVDRELTNYVVVYYPDVDANPGSWNIAAAILIGDANTELTISDLSEGLPIESDFNDEAKLWLIPEADWIDKSWNPTEWLFEHELITYTDARSGELIIQGEEDVSLIPVYITDSMLESGNYTITTTIA